MPLSCASKFHIQVTCFATVVTWILQGVVCVPIKSLIGLAACHHVRIEQSFGRTRRLQLSSLLCCLAIRFWAGCALIKLIVSSVVFTGYSSVCRLCVCRWYWRRRCNGRNRSGWSDRSDWRNWSDWLVLFFFSHTQTFIHKLCRWSCWIGHSACLSRKALESRSAPLPDLPSHFELEQNVRWTGLLDAVGPDV